MSTQLPFAITMGDAMGVGAETIVKAANRGLLHDCFVIGDKARLIEAADICGINLDIRSISMPQVSGTSGLAVFQHGPSFAGHEFGTVSARAGQASFDYLDEAIGLAKDKRIAGIVTAPIHKEAWAAAGVNFPGHTEVLADRAKGAEVAMLLGNDELRVVLTTIHVPLRDACDLINKERVLRTIKLANQACKLLGIVSPRIAVAGLNPHAGEGGLFGSEEIDHICPAIDAAKTDGINASGPYAGDTIFARARKGEFDIVVAQYHDQGLIPVKYMGIADGVNITIGLPFVRTSPDHGTAFDIAGKGIADEGSLVTALNYAKKLAEN
ncbi:MAG: 4-hydroxythreonine-4-phosphate dehydrogenase PdxA [Alphaproteobacteria bacterium]